MIGNVIKQPYEEIDLSVDFAAGLSGSETLSLDSVKAYNFQTGNETTTTIIATSPPPSISGSKAQFRVKAGTTGENHKITVRVGTSGGQKFEADLLLTIRED